MRTAKCTNQVDRLRRIIKSGRLVPGAMVGTEFALSQEWGLARNTVRRGIDDLVNEGLLERRPGKGLFVPSSTGPAFGVQIVVPNLAWPHCVQIARGAQLAGGDKGVLTQVYDAHGQMNADLEVIRGLPASAAAGAIIVSLHHRKFNEALYELKSQAYPFVLVDQRLQDFEVPTVGGDSYGGAYRVGRELAALGHRRIAFLGPLNMQAITDRLNGLRDAMLDAGVLFDRSLVVHLEAEGLIDWMNETVSRVEETLLPLLTRANRPTVVFDASGDVAPYVYRAARRAGLNIPGDLSVVTFDDSPIINLLEPAVARLRHSWQDWGKVAMELLIDQIGHKRRRVANPTIEHRTMPSEWVPGSSLAELASNSGMKSTKS